MIKFIRFAKMQIISTEICEGDKELVKIESKKYEEMWRNNKCADERMPRYQNEESLEAYELNISLEKARKEFRIMFDVDGIQQMLSTVEPQMMNLKEFEKLISNDLVISCKNYGHVRSEVMIPIQHKYNDLLVLDFEELGHHHYLLDGRHRYIEYKQQANPKIPVKIISSLDAYKYIVYKRDFIVYAILHNMAIFMNYANGYEKDLSGLINIEMYL